MFLVFPQNKGLMVVPVTTLKREVWPTKRFSPYHESATCFKASSMTRGFDAYVGIPLISPPSNRVRLRRLGRDSL